MLQELSDESRRMGLKMNIAKTKVMVVDNTHINVNNVLIGNVPDYVYLGQHYRGQHKTGSFGDDILRPSRNHGTQWLPNDDDEKVCLLTFNILK